MNGVNKKMPKLWFGIALAVVLAILPHLRGDTMSISHDKTFLKDAAREAALTMLPSLKTSRNALSDPGPLQDGRPQLGGYRPTKIKEWHGMTFDSELVKWDEMTYEEKLMLLGYPADSPRITLIHALAMMAYASYRNKHSTKLDVLDIPNPHLMTFDKLSKFLSDRISPVTGKLIEIDHPEFSRGNAFVRVVTEDEVKELVKLDPAIDEWWNYCLTSFGVNDPKDIRVTLTGREKLVDPRYTNPGKHEPYLVYVKFYGEKGILYEGLV